MSLLFYTEDEAVYRFMCERYRPMMTTPDPADDAVAGGVTVPGIQTDQFIKLFQERTVLGRIAEADEIAAGVAFLISHQFAYITEAETVVNEGITTW